MVSFFFFGCESSSLVVSYWDMENDTTLSGTLSCLSIVLSTYSIQNTHSLLRTKHTLQMILTLRYYPTPTHLVSCPL